MSRSLCILACLSMMSFAHTPQAHAGNVVRTWGGAGGDWTGWTFSGQGWSETTFPRANDPWPANPHLQSAEQQTGNARSPQFTLAGDVLEFWICGWDGQDGTEGKNAFHLRDAANDEILRTMPPPNGDAFIAGSWMIGDLRGRQAYFEAVDGYSNAGFAWLGLAGVREIELDVPTGESRYRALPLGEGLGVFGISEVTGAGQPTTPYLSSLVLGESRTGSVRSPEWTVSHTPIRLQTRGHDGQSGGEGFNYYQLVDAQTGDVLRTAVPPQTDTATWTEWDAADLAGRSVFVRVVDGHSGMGYAWLGLERIDAGTDYQATFDQGQASLAGWRAEDGGPSYRDLDGVPFMVNPQSALSPGNPLALDIGATVDRVFVLGLSNSLDQGCPLWSTVTSYAGRFFIGDRLGHVEVHYQDDTSETYPLILGDGMWWGPMTSQFREPFESQAAARQTLADNLRLYPPTWTGDGLYAAFIEPAAKPIRELRFVDGDVKQGAPIVRAVTIELDPAADLPGAQRLPHSNPEAALTQFVGDANKALKPEAHDRTATLAALRDLLYTTPGNLPEQVAESPPAGYNGPRVVFAGTPEAHVLTNVFSHNLHDMAGKVDQDGMYHTSSADAPSWGGYNSFGTWALGWGSYYQQIWARDMGRALMELVALGDLDAGRRCADHSLLLSRVWEEGELPGMNLQELGPLTLDGSPLPNHWVRRLNYPNSEPGQGCFDNDSHGLTMMFVYNLWRRLPDRNAWAEARWTHIEKTGDWIQWQFDNPALSGAQNNVLRTDSESSHGTGYSIYPDYTCVQGLMGYAEMAEALGRSAKAAEWRATAERLRSGIAAEYPITQAPYGTVWTLVSAGWPDQPTVLAPIILAADRRGFATEDVDAEFLPITENSYDWHLDRARPHVPFGFFGVAMGYNQGFVTQTALMLDRMEEAETLLEWTARLVYYDAPDEAFDYIVPEGAEVDPAGRFWHRTGDLGNGVQQAETIKSLRLVIGVDDTDMSALRIMPRMPRGWREVRVEGLAMFVEAADGGRRVDLDYHLVREPNRMTMTLSAGEAVEGVRVRLGAFAADELGGDVYVDGSPVPAQWALSGDSSWASMTLARIDSTPARIEVYNRTAVRHDAYSATR